MIKHRMVSLLAALMLAGVTYACNSHSSSAAGVGPLPHVEHQVRGQKVNERAATVRVIPDSKSIVLRSTHILLFRIEKVDAEAWQKDETRTVHLSATLETLFKGTLREQVNETFTASITQKQKRSPFILPPTDCWSEHQLTSGSRLIVFSRSGGTSAAEVLPDPKCQKVVAAADFLNDVRLAVSAETERWNLATLLENARPVASQLNYIFPM